MRNYRAEVLEALGLTHLSRLLPPIVDGVRQWHGLSSDAAVAGSDVGGDGHRPAAAKNAAPCAGG